MQDNGRHRIGCRSHIDIALSQQYYICFLPRRERADLSFKGDASGRLDGRHFEHVAYLDRKCPSDTPSVFLVAYLAERRIRQAGASGRRGFGSNPIRFGPTMRSIAFRLADALVAGAHYRVIERGLSDLFEASFDASWQSGSGVNPPAGPRSPIDFRIQKSLRFLSDGLTQGVALDTIARDAGLSRPHFFKLLRDYTGVTPALYANTMRIERALNWVMDSTASVTEIGHELGFASLSHFTHFFAAHVGIPPTQYRTVARVVGE